MTSKKIYSSLAELKEQVRKWQDENQKVVFTNGCFDIIHLGHIDYLEKSAQLGDKLIVAVNTDASVRQQGKGADRPINDEYARLRLLAALAFVDAVILFGEETPLKLIERLVPDILVKGDDYKIDDIVGADVVMKAGGEVKTISLVEGYSTSKIIDKIRAF